LDESQEPDLSALIPPAVMRAALTWTVPFAIVWAVGACGLWSAVLFQFGATWPPFWHSPEVGLGIVLIGAVFGAICAIAARLLVWFIGEKRRRRYVPRHVRIKDSIKTAQDWQEL
jgi:hypothetical protein